MSYADKTMTCRECGTQFTFTAGEQEFYDQKGFTNAPTRCPDCRAARKAAGGRGGSSSYSGGGSSYSGGGSYSSGGSRGGGAREMYTTTCSSCGKEAQVPFVPRGDKPVYCSDCFQSQRRSDSRW
jgi:CxxC-x17-CxxC domain-containing protein